ncbi:MAG: epoxyqueuosine reductase QueH [Kiritimatiellia bacterium]
MMKVLLHTCCAPCATHCIDVLQNSGYEFALFFSNANIFPAEEYNKRLQELIRLAGICGAALIVDETDHNDWLIDVAAGFEAEPEKGERCQRCFRYSLERTYAHMKAEGFDAFTTTLSVSPHKVSQVISAVGRDVSEQTYLDINFKKKDGFKHSLKLSKEYGLYRQNYCGCEFSMRE